MNAIHANMYTKLENLHETNGPGVGFVEKLLVVESNVVASVGCAE